MNEQSTSNSFVKCQTNRITGQYILEKKMFCALREIMKCWPLNYVKIFRVSIMTAHHLRV